VNSGADHAIDAQKRVQQVTISGCGRSETFGIVKRFSGRKS
jgi:hypothetical protein